MTVRSKPAEAPSNSTVGSRRKTLVVAVLGSSMAFLDGSVVNVALPVIQREMGMSAALAAWVVEAYALLLSALVLVGGAIGDRYGRKRVFVAGVMLFAAASVACGAAPTAQVLIGARALQGVGAAMLVPGSLSLITAAYPADTRGRAIGIWSMFSAMTTAAGPVAGGYVVGHASWRWVFLFNAPLAIVVAAIAHRGVEETRDDEAPRHMDWTGAALAAAGLGAVVYSLLDGGATTDTRGDRILLSAGLAVLVGFVIYESRAAAPMVPLSLFRSRAFSVTNALTLLLYAALGGGLYFLPFNLIQVQGYGAAAAGASLLPFVIALSALSPAMGALAARFGARPLLVAGPAVSAAGFALLALPSQGGSYWATYFPGVATLGIGMGITVAPLTSAVMGSVESHRAGVASGINNAVARAAGLLAVAGLAVLLRVRFDHALDARLDGLSLSAVDLARVASERRRLAGADLSSLDPSTSGGVRAAFGAAYVAGFRALAFTCAALAAMAALVGLLLPGSTRGDPRSPRTARHARESS